MSQVGVARPEEGLHSGANTWRGPAAHGTLSRVDVGAHIGALKREGLALADAVRGLDPAAPVPACPGWQVRDLLAHVGGMHRWAAAIVASGRTQGFAPGQEAAFFRAPGDERLLAWFRDGHAALVGALEAADPQLQAWQPLQAPSPLAFWARRQAHETAIHRADAESARGAVARFDPDFAADGIDELLNAFLARQPGALVADPPVSLAVRAVDAEQEWTVFVEPDRRTIVPEARDADCTVSGEASDLYLLLWNRATDRVGVSGDAAVLDLWRERARVNWA